MWQPPLPILVLTAFIMEKVLEKTGTLSSKDKGTYHVHDRIKSYHPFSLGWFHQSCNEIFSMTSKIISDQNVLVVLLHFLQMYKTIKLWNKVENGTLQNILSSWSGNFGSVQKKFSCFQSPICILWIFCKENVLGRNGELLCTTRNLTIFNIIRWLAGSMGRTTHRPSVSCSEYYFFFIISCNILFKNCFNSFFLYFFINLQKIEIEFRVP